jgi:signal recognition particle receptor subunit beta
VIVAANVYKVLFTGPTGAGKTTAIASLSDTSPIVTDTVAAGELARRKPTTTVAMDYGVMHLSVDEQLHLFGTPGQERFGFMGEILGDGALGVVVMVDNTADDPLGDLDRFVRAYRSLIDATAVAVAVTRTDLRPSPHLDDHVSVLARLGVHGPVFRVDARERVEVARLVEALLLTLEPGAGP